MSANTVILEIRDDEFGVYGRIDVGDHEDFPLAITITINDINDISSGRANFSKQFKIPSNKNNDIILGELFNANYVDSKNKKGKKKCFIYVNEKLFDIGYLRVTNIYSSSRGKEYECFYFSGNFDWVAQLKSIRLKDLFTETVTDFYKDGLIERWENPDNIYTYPLIYYGGQHIVFDNTVNLNGVMYPSEKKAFAFLNSHEFAPAIFEKEILDRILAELDYDFESVFFENGYDGFDFSKLIIPYSNGYLYEKVTQVDNDLLFHGKKQASYTIPLEQEISPSDGDVALHFTRIVTDNSNGDITTVETSFNLSTTFTPSKSGIYYFDIYLFVTNGIGDHRLTVKLTIDDEVQPNNPFLDQTTDNASNEMYARINDIYINEGSVVKIVAACSDIDGGFSQFQEVGGDSYIKIYNRKVAIFNGFDLKNCLPDISALDYLKSIAHRFNLRFFTDIKNKIIYADPEPLFFKSRTQAIDWTDKINLESDYQLSFIDNYHNALKLLYLKDSLDKELLNINEQTKYEYGSDTTYLSNRFSEGEENIQNNLLSPTFEDNYTIISTVSVFGYTSKQIFHPIDSQLNVPKISDTFYLQADENAMKFNFRSLYYHGYQNINGSKIYLSDLNPATQYLADNIIYEEIPNIPRATFIDFDGSSGITLSFKDYEEELIDNNTFDNSDGWTLIQDAEIASGVLRPISANTANSAAATYLFSVNLEQGVTYYLSFDLIVTTGDLNSISIRNSGGSHSQVILSSLNQTNHYEYEFQPTYSDQNQLYVYLESNMSTPHNMSIDNISIKRIHKGLKNRFYKKTLHLIEKGNLLNVDLKLHPNDIMKLDMRTPIFFDYEPIRGYWTINKIKDFKPNETLMSTCEFIQLDSTI